MAILTMSTARIYYQDTYLHELTATIVETGSDEKGAFVVFDRTIFHPQGGGQPKDEGFFEVEGHRIAVTQLAIDAEVIKHYYMPQECVSIEVNQIAKLTIDPEKRAQYARLHSAGHLIANAVKKLYPQLSGCKGNHFPGGQATVSCDLTEGEALPDLTELKSALIVTLSELVKREIPLINSFEATPRTVQFEGYPAYSCGGTHVRHSGEIGEVVIRNVKIDKGLGCKIGYDVK